MPTNTSPSDYLTMYAQLEQKATEDEIKKGVRVVKDYQSGRTVQSILDDYSISTTDLYNLLRRYGVSKRLRPVVLDDTTKESMVAMYLSGVGLHKVAKAHHLSLPRARAILVAEGVEIRPKGKSRTHELPGLSEEYRAGASIKTLAEKHSCSRGVVQQRLKEAGVEIRPRGRPSKAVS